MLPEFCKCRVRRNRKAQGVNLMKNYIAAIITIVFLICPSICFSSCLIELKNGSTFIINHYWKEGRQIKFYFRGGVVGIEKEFVREIRESDLPYIVEKPRPAREENVQAKAEYKPESEQEKETLLPPHPESEIRRLKKASKKAWERYNEVCEHGTMAERDKVRKEAWVIDQKLKELTRESSVQ